MRNACRPILLLALLVGALPAHAVWNSGLIDPGVRPEFVPGELIVKFRPAVDEASRQTLRAVHGLAVERPLESIGAELVRLPEGADVRAEAAALAALPEVEYADPNYLRYIEAFPNDPRFDELWGMHSADDTDIDGPEAWDVATGSHDVLVGVLDSGMDLDHVDLAANLWTNPGEIADNGIDDDGNGFVDDVHGWDFRDDDNDPSPAGGFCLGHGTHTAGTVGAVGNNGVGVTGVSWNVSIMPVRAFYVFLLIFCTADDADLVDAIDYMTMMGVDVSNNSWGGTGFSNALRDAVLEARHLFVAASGNSSQNTDVNPSYPASYPFDHIVSVAATNESDGLSFFSNFGEETVDLGAPGSGILSTKPGNAYGYLDGTSMASPHVAGAAAVLLAREPGLTPREMKDRLLRGTDFVGLQVATGGRLNLNESLTLPAPEVVVDVEPVGSTDISPGDTFEYSVELRNDAAGSRTFDVQVSIWTPRGGEVVVAGPVNVTLAGGDSRQVTLSQTLPGGAPAGTYWLIGQASDGVENFDEDVVLYEVM